MTMRKITFMLLISLLISNLNAQKLYLELNRNYATARIYERNRPGLKVKNLKLLADTLLQYSVSNSGKSLAMQTSMANIKFVSIKAGTHALSYGIYGGSLGFACILASVIKVKSDPNYVDTGEKVGVLIAGFTAGGFVVGALIGAFVPRWKAYNLSNKQTSFSYRLLPSVNKNFIGVGLVAKF